MKEVWSPQLMRLNRIEREQKLTSCLPASLIIGSPLSDVRGPPGAAVTQGQNFSIAESRLSKSNRRWRLERKPLPCSILGRFARAFPQGYAHVGNGFVNCASLMFRLGWSQGVFEGRRCGVPT